MAVKAALSLAALCARDEALQQQLATVEAIPRIVGLLGRPFSERGLHDLVEALHLDSTWLHIRPSRLRPVALR